MLDRESVSCDRKSTAAFSSVSPLQNSAFAEAVSRGRTAEEPKSNSERIPDQTLSTITEELNRVEQGGLLKPQGMERNEQQNSVDLNHQLDFIIQFEF